MFLIQPRLAILAFPLLFTGCANLASFDALKPDPSTNLELRKEAVVSDFEKQRNKAQVAAAGARYDQGDESGAVALLLDVIERAPDHVPALSMLANIQMVNGRSEEAIKHRRQLVRIAPTDAEQHHALAMLLESNDQAAEAQQYFERTLHLEPENELYQATYEAAQAAAESPSAE